MTTGQPQLTEPDPTGIGGQAPLEAASWWLIGAGLMLLLPRQWASAGIAFLLGLGLRFWHRTRLRAGKPAESVDR